MWGHHNIASIGVPLPFTVHATYSAPFPSFYATIITLNCHDKTQNTTGAIVSCTGYHSEHPGLVSGFPRLLLKYQAEWLNTCIVSHQRFEKFFFDVWIPLRRFFVTPTLLVATLSVWPSFVMSTLWQTERLALGAAGTSSDESPFNQTRAHPAIHRLNHASVGDLFLPCFFKRGLFHLVKLTF